MSAPLFEPNRWFVFCGNPDCRRKLLPVGLGTVLTLRPALAGPKNGEVEITCKCDWRWAVSIAQVPPQS